MGKPFISVVIPALNEEKFLPHLLESLTRQTYKDFEVIVVDGRSKDKTVEKAKAFGKTIKCLTVIIADHASLPHQRNLGAEKSAGEWLVFVDADSIFLPYTMERIKEYIKTHHAQFFTSWVKPDSEVSSDALLSLLFNIYLEGTKLLKRSGGSGPCTIVARSVFEKVHGYDINHPFLEDQDLTQRIEKSGVPLHILRETLYVWSMRRYRKEGVIKVMQAYAKAALPILFFKETPKNMTGYVMGGHVFEQKNKIPKKSLLKTTELKIKKLMKELFA